MKGDWRRVLPPLFAWLATVAALLAVTLELNDRGSRTTTVQAPAAPLAKTAGRCSPANWAMQCSLPLAPENHYPRIAGATDTSLFGIDFAWGAPSVSAIVSSGARFAASYFSYDPSKDWTAGLVNGLHRAGVSTVAVWETTATRAADGWAAGHSDALQARSEAYGVGLPQSRSDWTIDFAIDFDASGPQVASYFQGAGAAIGTSHVAAYGGYTPLGWLCARHLTNGRSWQAYAWSYGHWQPASCAPLEQTSNSHNIGGSDTDFDRAIAPDFGQWPPPGPPPPPPYPYGRFVDDHFRYYDRLHHRFLSISERGVVREFDRLNAHPWANRYRLHDVRQELLFLRRRLWGLVHAGHVCVSVSTCAPVKWSYADRGWRFGEIYKRSIGVRQDA